MDSTTPGSDPRIEASRRNIEQVKSIIEQYRRKGDHARAERLAAGFWRDCLHWGKDRENFCFLIFLRGEAAINELMAQLQRVPAPVKERIECAVAEYRLEACRLAEEVCDARITLAVETAANAAAPRLDELDRRIGELEMELAENEAGVIDRVWELLGAPNRGMATKPVIEFTRGRATTWRPVTPCSERPLFKSPS